ncbi:hypothetical protein ACLB2K_072052 [Fragaria x ananassa]
MAMALGGDLIDLTISYEYKRSNGLSLRYDDEQSEYIYYYARIYDDEMTITWKGTLSRYGSTLGLVKSIDISSNKLTGEIPSEITRLVGLVSLNLSRNYLTGQITRDIGKLQSLDSLDLSRNLLHGSIPTSLFQIYGLGYLDLSYNNLSGKIPMDTESSPRQVENPGTEEEEEDDGLNTQGFYISATKEQTSLISSSQITGLGAPLSELVSDLEISGPAMVIYL